MYTTYLGGHMEYAVECAVGELFVIDQRVESPIAAGAAVSITSRLRRDGRAARPLSACPRADLFDDCVTLGYHWSCLGSVPGREEEDAIAV